MGVYVWLQNGNHGNTGGDVCDTQVIVSDMIVVTVVIDVLLIYDVEDRCDVSYSYTSTCIYLCTPVYTCIYLYTCIHLYIPVYTCIHLCTPVHTCIHLYTPVYLHIHTCTVCYLPPAMRSACCCYVRCQGDGCFWLRFLGPDFPTALEVMTSPGLTTLGLIMGLVTLDTRWDQSVGCKQSHRSGVWDYWVKPEIIRG